MMKEILTNPFDYYKQLIDSLLQLDEVKIVPLYELQTTSTENVRLIGLRHDIDNNPASALRAARYLARNGICGSFYLLHTSSYYGCFRKGVFNRDPMMAKLVLRFIVAGCEIGLHNDAYGVYTNYECDGSRILRTELDWLRSLGALVRGTVAHNSAPVYRAENYEIFIERVLWQREVRSPSGIILPLGKLSEKELNLSYEGSFAIPKENLCLKDAENFCEDLENADIRSETWMRRYLINNPCCNWAIDYQFWLIGKDRWVAAGKYEGKELFEWDIDLNRLLFLIHSLPENSRSILVIHPDYFEPEKLEIRQENALLISDKKEKIINQLKNESNRRTSIIFKIYRRIKFWRMK